MGHFTGGVDLAFLQETLLRMVIDSAFGALATATGLKYGLKRVQLFASFYGTGELALQRKHSYEKTMSW